MQIVLLILVLANLLTVAQAQPSSSAHQLGRVLLLTFDSDQPQADRNDFGDPKPLDPKGFRLTEPGTGCPANPKGRALDAGFSDEFQEGCLSFALPTDADLRQGTVEFWFKPKWSMGAREGHTLFQIKLRGGYWNSIWLGYHGTIGATTEAFGVNIMDGADHPAYVRDAEAELGWKAGEWHHIAFTWTDYSIYVFADGKLVAQVISKVPFRIGANEGKVVIGGGFRDTKPTANGLIDEFRFCDLPLYSPGNPPEPMRRVSADLGLGLAGPGSGAKAFADSTAPPHPIDDDVPELHDGQYGNAVQVGTEPGKGMVTVHLPDEFEVIGFEWSRDGVPYAGPQGRGWALVLPYPRAFIIEVSRDGQNWEKVVEELDFRITPEFVAKSEALRFRHNFEPRLARQIRMTIHKGPRGDPMMLLDEVAVYSPDGRNLARLPGVRVEIGMTARMRSYDPSFAIDGRWGEESCWKSAKAKEGILTVELPEIREVSKLVFSRSHEGLEKGGTPSAGRVEISLDGQDWQVVGEFQSAEPKTHVIVFKPQKAKFIRLVITNTVDGKEAIVDDLRVY